jgi:hypothetical protein
MLTYESFTIISIVSSSNLFYLFIYYLFTDAVISSDHTALNDRMIGEL